MNKMLQSLSGSPFDKTPVNQLFTKDPHKKIDPDSPNQLILFDLYPGTLEWYMLLPYEFVNC